MTTWHTQFMGILFGITLLFILFITPGFSQNAQNTETQTEGFLSFVRLSSDNKVILVYVSAKGTLNPAQVDLDGSVSFADNPENAVITLSTIDENGNAIPLALDSNGDVMPILASADGVLLLPSGANPDANYLPTQISADGKLIPLLVGFPETLLAVSSKNDGTVIFAGAAGAAAAEPVVEKPFKVDLSIDNSGSALTGHTVLTANITHSNLWGLGHSGALLISTTRRTPEKSTYISGDYTVPFAGLVKGSDDELVFSVSHYSSRYGTRGTGDAGMYAGASGSLDFTQNIATSTDDNGTYKSHALKYNFTYDKSWTRTYGASTPDSTSLLRMPISIGYDFVLDTPRLGFILSSLTYTRGLGIGKAGSSNDYTTDRANATPRYQKVLWNFYQSKEFKNQWGISNSITAQFATKALVSSETIGLGGEYSIRGLASSKTLGDRGAFGQFELISPNQKITSDWSYKAFAFTDMGYVQRLHLNATDTPKNESAISFGGGTRIKGRKGAYVNVSGGWLAAGSAKKRYSKVDGNYEIFLKAGVVF